MAASLEELKDQIAAAERVVHAADARAAESSRALKAHWRAKAPTVLIGGASAFLALQLLRGGGSRRRSAHRAPSGWGRTFQPLLRFAAPQLVPAISALVAGLVAKKAKKPLTTAPWVDLGQYAGTWYEIARLPEKHEKDCVSDVTATYEPTVDGGLRVINRCRRANGSIKRAIGRAEVADPESNAKLRVSFAPQLLDALPFVWSDYYVIDVASDYSTAVVGSPDRAHLWLLAREPSVSEDVRSAFIAKALGQQFDTSQLIYTRHTAPSPAGEDVAIPAPPHGVPAAAAGNEGGSIGNERGTATTVGERPH